MKKENKYNRKNKTKRISLFKFSRAEFEAFEREYWKKYNTN
tara:strand:- start:2123 stop:2245 length:123 start_codon:yes stop_codon:yes gene_type:complete